MPVTSDERQTDLLRETDSLLRLLRQGAPGGCKQKGTAMHDPILPQGGGCENVNKEILE